jgi:hypothetical protein
LEKLVIRWPSGFVQELGPISSVDRTVTVNEGGGLL